MFVNLRTASWHPGQGSSIVVQHVPIPGIVPKEIIDDAIYGGDQVISSIKPIIEVGHASEGIAAIGRIPAEEKPAYLT